MASSKAGVSKGDLPSLISLNGIALQHLNEFPDHQGDAFLSFLQTDQGGRFTDFFWGSEGVLMSS